MLGSVMQRVPGSIGRVGRAAALKRYYERDSALDVAVGKVLRAIGASLA
jgi:hypothetical protein